MKTPCDVRLDRGGPWQPATLTDDDSPMSGVPMVVTAADGKAHGARAVNAVRVTSTCPVALFDAAVEAGYFVLGAPGKKRKKKP